MQSYGLRRWLALTIMASALSASPSRAQQAPACPLAGSAQTARVRALNVLKNRTAIPSTADLDLAVTDSARQAPSFRAGSSARAAQPPIVV